MKDAKKIKKFLFKKNILSKANQKIKQANSIINGVGYIQTPNPLNIPNKIKFVFVAFLLKNILQKRNIIKKLKNIPIRCMLLSNKFEATKGGGENIYKNELM